ALSHFTGQETLAVTDATGAVQTYAVIDFDQKTISQNGAPGVAFTNAASFTSALNQALSDQASVDFTTSPATIVSADRSAGSTKRLVLVGGSIASPTSQIGGTPATKGGQSFSAYFGLNDLVSSSGLSSYATGLQPADASGYSGGAISLRLTAPDGSTLRDVSVSTPAGDGSMQALTAALSTAVQPYGGFSLDSTGALAFTPGPGSGAAVQVDADTTARNGSGPSISTLFGIGDSARSARLGQLAVRQDIQGDPSKLALAKWDPSKTPPLSAGDGAGADALAQAANTPLAFGAAGGAAATTASLSNYAAAFGAATARAASAANDAATSAASVKTEADTRRSSAEGVNMDQELINMTTYQQAYSASARMIQAVKDMYDALLNMV
ncbi:MAG: flagellar hook-associated protein FlgK, partial [Caulobacteraceae bacterium]|nr:flagellar hook-associated protein FlgK [Caulobacter sp.]